MPTNQVSIDRITVSGELKAEYRELQRVMNALGSSWELSDGVFRLIREYPNGDTENVAYYAENAFQAGSWRLDFNPNKLADEEKLEMKRAIDLLTDVHFTRLDLAFDVFNNELGMKYRIYRPNVSQREYGVYTAQWTKAVETIYYGSNSSEQQIRQYNKLVEQTKKNMPLPDGVEHWMRLELQLRGRKPTEWVERAKGMLDDFRLPNYDRIKNKNDRMALFALEKGLLDWSDFSDKNKKARLRKLQKEQYDDTLARELFDLLIAQQERLRGELASYLAEFDIQE
ncbi:replication initiation factor domain-containing protein [Weissella cibaria]|uniref:replication initiation factor domain-containing protein n=1 Tax=Weissella cibaria TaxID=137591 RepID=UPI0015F507B7|nr:replication initiation factor domain-containing protein [Weissella cibaria]MBA5963540.1 replication initiation factor domain-containing protein [Weissella cibaria]MCG4286361.1 replication initiation factor domain-containing protein [Weissella cibaria]